MVEKIGILQAIEKLGKGEIELENILFHCKDYGLIQCESLKIYDDLIELHNFQIDLELNIYLSEFDTQEIFIYKKD